MTAPLLDLDGLFHGGRALTIADALAHATVDVHGCVLVAMLDVLALARVDAAADMLMLHHADGSNFGLRISDTVAGSEVHLALLASELRGAHCVTWSACLRIDGAAPAAPVRSICAMSFASFVGLS